MFAIVLPVFFVFFQSSCAQAGPALPVSVSTDVDQILPGASNMEAYLPLLRNKRVALLINQTSTIGRVHLLDTLIRSKINVVKVFVPEHGFRGTADAGAHIKSSIDKATGLPVISLYGDNKKPKKEQLEDVDVVIYDLQDVGARFYTYISSLEYLMEACAEQGKTLLVLDRPNPNGHYVDGPVLEESSRSFVGMQKIPVVYGMTAGEYAGMLAGEKWVGNAAKLSMTVIPCGNYDHSKRYSLPVAPSPNLRTMEAIYLYPSLCFFEGTVVSVGRGTPYPFQQWGHPQYKGIYQYAFTPRSGAGASKPVLEGQASYGMLIATNPDSAYALMADRLNLSWLIEAYKNYPDKQKFFNNFFEKLAGTKKLKKQIEEGMTEAQIRKTWEQDLNAFKSVRKKYLLYPDFTD
ncbi:MAG: DUF1343 domain-containing protein [Chitinophagaceae bacterium]|nr:MAG: DUF1343 domain-containing protein [Chitinophagaceae bacterium]